MSSTIEAAPRRGPEPVLLTTTPVNTFDGQRALTGASGFFFRHSQKLFLITNRHVLIDEAAEHFPDRIEIEFHVDPVDLTQVISYSIPLYSNGQGLWRQAADSGGTVDLAAIEIEAHRLDHQPVAFTADNLAVNDEVIQVGDPLLIIGQPLGFRDTIHRLPVARGATIASAFGVRFQQQGFFLTDARMHRGSSGSPVVRRRLLSSGRRSLAGWQLVGVHSTRMDMRSRDLELDESLGLNCAWYADVLMVLVGR